MRIYRNGKINFYLDSIFLILSMSFHDSTTIKKKNAVVMIKLTIVVLKIWKPLERRTKERGEISLANCNLHWKSPLARFK